MARPKKGTKGAEEATRKWRKTMQWKYGGVTGVHNMMRAIGGKGGRNGRGPDYKGGFASDPELARRAGAKAGEKSRRGLTYMGEEGTRRRYIDKNTGEVVVYQYDMQSQKYVRVN